MHFVTRCARCSALLALLATPQLSPAVEDLAPTSYREVYLCMEKTTARIRVNTGHPWRPPFGVERVGAPPVVNVELTRSQAPRGEYRLTTHQHDGKELEHQQLSFTRDGKLDLEKLIRLYRNPNEGKPETVVDVGPFFGNSQLTSIPSEVSLHVRCEPHGNFEEVMRQPVHWPELEIDAMARPDPQINPIDLGTILVPNDWLLLKGEQPAVIDVAAISHNRDLPNARLRVAFDSGEPLEVPLPLSRHNRVSTRVRADPPHTWKRDTATLSVSLIEGERELWQKQIHTMIVAKPPRWPAFGAVETKLRYDAPISVKSSNTSTYSSIDYDTAWKEKFKDVVVFLPNGSRFVFWRGSSYIPFWAGKYNSGLSYQWAEMFGAMKDAVDAVEPLQDKDLRYSNVRIVESTPSRVHVRWTYQSTDFVYQVWGDHATEDFYFYPDGFGTRVLTIVSDPDRVYQVTEFIVVTPQLAYPLQVLPNRLVEMLYVDGEKNGLAFPNPLPKAQERGTPVFKHLMRQWVDPPQKAAIYRIFDHKEDPAAAIYFSPRDIPKTLSVFKPFYDRGSLVTPAYWGNHWPLGRGALTGGTIDNRIYCSPSHISLMGGFERDESKPLFTAESQMPDTLGNSRLMEVRRWAWLIGKTDSSDSELLDWAESFSSPPSLQVTGARINFPSYSHERRALGLIVETAAVEIKLKPAKRAINPVFELENAPEQLTKVTIDGKPLLPTDYAWDGATLWLKAAIDASGATVGLHFRPRSAETH